MTVAVDVFRVLASITSTLMILSPIPNMRGVLKTRSTGVLSVVPLVSMLANCHMNMLYGYLIKDMFPMFATFIFGDALSLTYIAVFLRYTDDRATALRAIAVFVGALALATLYAVLGVYAFGQTRGQVADIIGYLSIISTVVLYSSPFEKIGLVLKHRSAAFLPIHMVVAGTVTNTTWVVYSLLIREWIVFAPNAFTVVVGVLQIALYVAFNPRTHPLALADLSEPKTPSKDGDLGMEADAVPLSVVVVPSVSAGAPQPLSAASHVDARGFVALLSPTA